MHFQTSFDQRMIAPAHDACLIHAFSNKSHCLKRCIHNRPGIRRYERRRVSAASETPQQEQQQAAAGSAQHGRKLGRFSPNADIRRSLLNFHYEAEVDAGTLVVRPLSLAQLREVTDLLTDVFAASEDPIGLYTRYMRTQIRQYLDNHLKVAPDAVVLVAVLLGSQRGSSIGSSGGSSAVAPSAGNTSAEPAAAGYIERPPEATDSAAATPAGLDAAAGAAPQPRRRQQEVDNGVLVGTVEVSFTDSTRTRFLTLNPPKDTAYLGNMCTAPGHRRHGYGTHLLRAAERLTQLAAYPVLYLHLRFRDTEAAAMYERAGYDEVARDMFLLPLVGIQRRWLMSRHMPRRSRN